MKKRVFGKKLSRERDSRRALYRSLTAALVEHGKIKTTKAKAKTIQPFIDRLVTFAREGSTASLRRVYARLGNDNKTAKKLFEEVAPVFSKRTSGFTRIINLGTRKGDRAQMARLEWVEIIPEKAVEKKEKKTKEKKETKKQAKKTTKKEPVKKVKKESKK